MRKPTITTCIDGKGHAWLIACEETDEHGHKWEHRWCQKCGSLTQVTYNEKGEAIAALNSDQSPFILIPKVMNAVTK